MARKNDGKPPPKKRKFGEAFAEQLEAQGISVSEAARRLNVRRQTVDRWIKHNVWPRDEFRDVCAVADMRDERGQPLGWSEAAKMYEIKETQWQMNRWDRDSSSLDDSLKKVDKLMLPGLKAFRKAADETPEVFGQMGRNHFLVVFTGTVEPLVYRYRSQFDVARWAIKAVRNEAVLAVVTPTPATIARYADHWRFDRVEEYEEFVQSYSDFRAWAVEQWKGSLAPTVARDHFDSHVIQLEVEECPYFTPGWTFSLFGEYLPGKTTMLRGAFRSPDDLMGLWQLYPPCRLFEPRLRQTASLILREEIKRLKKLPPEQSETPARLRCAKRLQALIDNKHGALDEEAYGA